MGKVIEYYMESVNEGLISESDFFFNSLRGVDEKVNKCLQNVSKINSCTLKKGNLDYARVKNVSPTQLFENQLLDYKQAAQYLSLSEAHLRRLKQKGKIPFVTMGSRGIRFKLSSLDSWVKKKEIK